MPRTRRWVSVGWLSVGWVSMGWMVAGPLLAASVLLVQTTAQAPTQTAAPTPAPAAAPKPHKRHNAHKAPKPLVLPPLPAGPLSQVPLDQLKPMPAEVSYQGGLLTISAQNSTLGEILRDVRKLTGAAIEIPKDSTGASERVIAHLGPGAPRDVLAVLLNGTSFNYVILGSLSDPTAVASVILMAKASAAGEAQTATNADPNNPGAAPVNRFTPPFSQRIMPQPGQPQAAQTVEADDDADDADNADDNADDQAQPGQPAANVQEQQQPDANQQNAGPRTPEQVLEMLQRQRQQGGPGSIPPQPPQ